MTEGIKGLMTEAEALEHASNIWRNIADGNMHMAKVIIANSLRFHAFLAADTERARCATIAEKVQGRAAENAQELMMRPRSLTLEQMREIDNRLAGQRHAADEIARAIRA